MKPPSSLLRLLMAHRSYAILSAVILIISVTPLNSHIPALDAAVPWSRLTYSFRHANILHAIINIFVFFQIIRYFHVSAARLAVAYLIAVFVPPLLITAPAAGLSVIVYALFGLIMPFVARGYRKKYFVSVIVFVIPQVIIPHFAWHLHLYAFLTACALVLPSLKE